MQIRLAEPQDAEAIEALVREVVSTLAYYTPEARRAEIGKYSGSALAEALDDRATLNLVAVGNGDLLGVILNKEDDGLLWINWFLTSPRARRSGAARALILASMDHARERGLHKIWCDTRTENVPSMTLLTQLGFVNRVRFDRHWFGQDFFLWERPLA